MLKKAKKSQNQIIALNLRRNNGLIEAQGNNPGFDCQGIVGQFIGYYLRCELFATKVQHFYQTDKSYKKTRLNTKALCKAFVHFNMHLDDEVLLKLFQGGEGKRGVKSARQLRNGYLHQLSSSDRREIELKGQWFVSEMKKVLNLRIKT